jgi:hypothetical protein
LPSEEELREQFKQIKGDKFEELKQNFDGIFSTFAESDWEYWELLAYLLGKMQSNAHQRANYLKTTRRPGLHKEFVVDREFKPKYPND